MDRNELAEILAGLRDEAVDLLKKQYRFRPAEDKGKWLREFNIPLTTIALTLEIEERLDRLAAQEWPASPDGQLVAAVNARLGFSS